MPRKKNEIKEEAVIDASEAETATEGTQNGNAVETGAQLDEAGSPVVSLEDFEKLQAELEQAQTKASEYLDGWQRSMAEFANYKKRIDREQTLNQQMAKANVIRRFLDLFDDLDRAIKNRPQDGDGAGWAEGIELINRKFQNYLQNEGVETIETEGQSFDPTLHEAISQEDHPNLESGQIIGVVQQGYRIGDRILRPARVRVAR